MSGVPESGAGRQLRLAGQPDLADLMDRMIHRERMCDARCEGMRGRIRELEETLREIRRDIEEYAEDVVWLRGGIETVCDRIAAMGRAAGAKP